MKRKELRGKESNLHYQIQSLASLPLDDPAMCLLDTSADEADTHYPISFPSKNQMKKRWWALRLQLDYGEADLLVQPFSLQSPPAHRR